ncbi:MAG: PIN/TRAM domain-containing protein [Anaerolineae bacterium]
MSIEFIFRLLGMAILSFLGWELGLILAEKTGSPHFRFVLVLSLAGAAIGLLVTPWLTTKPFFWIRRKIRQVPSRHLVAGTIGLAIGLIISALLALPLSLLPSPFGKFLPLIAAMAFSYLGITVLVMRERDLFNIIGSRFGRNAMEGREDNCVLLDTSVIIDGRIADISQTGFISGTMLVPRFILDEIQHIADSTDALRRNRGRRGLDMLNKLQKESVVPIQITDMDVEEIKDVDGKLVKLARLLSCPIITNDYNLNRVAELQGVTVLNVNELANAVKAVVLPGESINVRIIQEGKEFGQGVGYLDDGTMIVVEDGRKHIDSTINVTVTRVLQTMAGRMIFAQPEGKEKPSRR